jgi:murein tripeptide amidase MpaA
MHETGVDFHLDVHGDEALPYNFIAGFEGIPSLTEQQTNLYNTYQDTLCKISPDFQKEKGYPTDKPGEANLGMCTNYMAETFGCLAMTLEMPFKDNANLPDDEFGWSPERSKYLAKACLDTLAHIIDDL